MLGELNAEYQRGSLGISPKRLAIRAAERRGKLLAFNTSCTAVGVKLQRGGNAEERGNLVGVTGSSARFVLALKTLN